MLTEKRICQECSEPLYGRADKKFCCDQCRNTFNNRNNSDVNRIVRNINYALRRNRRILSELNDSEKTRLERNRLIMHGFSFKYFTHTRAAKNGTVYYFCYEMGYVPLDEEDVLIVSNESVG
ncbi:MAG: hypothetical protein HQ500_04980 [Flavobacteriales bacterium]|nr:hypothetical protein [Flavobacteriales bacterium]